MARTSYDDWNFMGESQPEDLGVRGAHLPKIQQINTQRNSFILLCAVVLLTFMGLVCVYSASFEMAVASGLPHYYYLIRQLIYVVVGITLMVAINVLPEVALKVLSPIMFFSSIILLVFDTVTKKNILMNTNMVNFLFLSLVMYMSLYFSGRGNDIQKVRQLVVPVIGCIMVLVLILIQRNFSYALMFLALSVAMFAAGGVGLIGIILLVLYAAVPVICVILSKSDRILAVARFLIPGLGVTSRTSDIMAIRSALASGSWFGKGLGGGMFKDGAISDIAGTNILACIGEEIGFWGLIFIFVLFAAIGVIGYVTAKNVRRKNGYLSNLAIGISTMLVWQFLLNVAWVLGYILTDGLPMPFFSFGANIIPVLLESGILYRIARVKICSEASEKVMSSIQDELMFPERYDLENN